MTLIQGTNGNLYGTTASGGLYNYGSVFEMTPAGALTTLYSFCSHTHCTDGYAPSAGLVQVANGTFYGTTSAGGVNIAAPENEPAGTIFKMTQAGNLTTLYSFCAQSNCADGTQPNGLVQFTNGDFYGVTGYGGPNEGAGTVFKITPGGVLTTLYGFCAQPNCADGANPTALVLATNGNFYGTTWAGGTNNGGSGTVFKITPAGKLTTIASVVGYPDSLIQASDGNFYGTTAHAGTVFKVTPSGEVTTLAVVGGYPYAGLVQASDGNLYGTTYVGGANNSYFCEYNGCGSIFQLTLGGMLTTLYNFCSLPNCPDGYQPLAGLAQATNGELYGTTVGGAGTTNWTGTIFSLNVGLGPFVETRPGFGGVGAAIEILGTNLTGATSVTFNGTAAAFEVVRPSEIKAVVPAGASSGPVQVSTQGGSLSSNVAFLVRP